MKIEVSIGELVDKVTILSIKLKRIKDENKLKNVRNEYEKIVVGMRAADIHEDSENYLRLLEVNETLWDIEDRIRLKESLKEFDDEFIQLARSVYFENDKRAEIKRKINLTAGSDIVEEKEYVDYMTSEESK